jgi:hypothetical protein
VQPAGFDPGRPGLVISQKAPRRKPGGAGLHAVAGAMRWRFVRWNHVRSCGMDGGLVVMPGVPGFPTGAAWNGDGTDALFNPSTPYDSQP